MVNQHHLNGRLEKGRGGVLSPPELKSSFFKVGRL